MFEPGRPPGELRSARSPRAWITLMAACLIGLWCDQYSKSWAFESVADRPVYLEPDNPARFEPSLMIPHHEGVDPLPGPLLRFRLALNNGAVFGVGANRRALLILLTSVALAGAIFVFAVRTHHRQLIAHAAIGLILAGGFGNLVDRLRFGVVRDFIQLLPQARLPGDRRWPGGSPELMPWVFNIADVLLLAGTVLFLGLLWRARLAENAAAESAGDSVEPA